MIDNVSIIHKQGHVICNQIAFKYGNLLQVNGDMVIEQSPVTTHRKCGGLTLKEEGCSDNINVVV